MRCQTEARPSLVSQPLKIDNQVSGGVQTKGSYGAVHKVSTEVQSTLHQDRHHPYGLGSNRDRRTMTSQVRPTDGISYSLLIKRINIVYKELHGGPQLGHSMTVWAPDHTHEGCRASRCRGGASRLSPTTIATGKYRESTYTQLCDSR